MVLGKAACAIHNLSLLVFPNAKLFTVSSEGEEYDIIAEQRLDIIPDHSAQEKRFEECGASLNEAIRQLTVLIAKTGYYDVEWRNNPVLENSLDADGNRKLAMIEFEHLGDAEQGIIGGLSTGLIRCVNEEQGKIVVEEAKKHMNWTDWRSEYAKKQQEAWIEELADGVRLKEFYTDHNIQRGDEQILIRREELDFSAYPQSDELQQLALDVIRTINEKTTESSQLGSVKGRRYVLINTWPGSFYRKDRTRPDPSIGDDYENDQEYHEATYLGIVVKKLIELGHIFKIDMRTESGYVIQA